MEDPVIEIIKQSICSRCGEQCVFCDCWVEDMIQPERLSEETTLGLKR